MSSRSLTDLFPQTQDKCRGFLAECEQSGLRFVVTCTYRSFAEQDFLYAKGRTAPGKQVTKVRSGQSFHNVRRALDVALLNSEGKLDWAWMDSPAAKSSWWLLGKIAKNHGLQWGGDWHDFQDKPHVEDRYCATHDTLHRAIEFNEDGSCKDNGDKDG